MRTVVAASAIGTTVEWYDFLIYGTAASLVLNKLFFPTHDPLVGKLIAISTIGVGFFARPLGAVILSHFGDRLGRKSMLILTLGVWVYRNNADWLASHVFQHWYRGATIVGRVSIGAGDCSRRRVGWSGLNGYRTLSA
jgi:MFS family permease